MTSKTQAPGLRWGIFGAARIARDLIPAIRASGGTVEIVGVRDPASEHARSFAQEWDIPRLDSYQDVVDAEIDAIYNPLPNDVHLTWSERAMRAGKHALTEKPLSLNAQQAQQFAAVAADTGRVSLEAFAYRFQPHVRRIQEIVSSGELGELRHFQGSFGFLLDNPSDFRWIADKGGGALYDVGCYPVNFMRLLLGEPRSAQAAARYTDQGVDMALGGVLDYGSALAQISGGFDWGFRPELVLTGKEAVLEMVNPFESNSHSDLTVRVGEREETFAPSNGYTLMVEHFTRAVRGEETLLYPPADAVKQARVLDALFESARTGQRVEISSGR